ncbi:hypothetical protein GOA61_24015 [Sinorhizobium meliloti]|nr:hypothetical protein [Sinorhizobium meliloti]
MADVWFRTIKEFGALPTKKDSVPTTAYVISTELVPEEASEIALYAVIETGPNLRGRGYFEFRIYAGEKLQLPFSAFLSFHGYPGNFWSSNSTNFFLPMPHLGGRTIYVERKDTKGSKGLEGDNVNSGLWLMGYKAPEETAGKVRLLDEAPWETVEEED